MRVLVTGAAGFIGSVVTEQLLEHGIEVVALDNLQHGHAAAVHPAAEFVLGDLRDGVWLKQFLVGKPVDAIVHLAAEALIDESVRNPGRFYEANVCAGLNLLEAMQAAGVNRIIFSSTAAVYGEPQQLPILEDSPQLPVNSYGQSKLAFEQMLKWYRVAYGLNHISLRYFNACGATERFGELHQPETHLIPILLEIALGKREAIHLFGTDYDTPDGTCVRDYIHVADIARAHLLALQKVDEIGAAAYNMGNGSGYTNRQVIDTVQKITGCPIRVIPSPRRPGDPARLVASSDKVRRELGWEPQYPDLTAMVDSAWQWRLHHPGDYTA